MKLTKLHEDYLEKIYNLSEKTGFTTVEKLADYIQADRETVVRVTSALSELEMIIQPDEAQMLLTEAGRALAAEIARRHITIRSFLADVLELDYDTAEAEACSLEHALSEETAVRMARLMEKLKADVHFQQLFSKNQHTLRDLQPGDTARVVSVSGPIELKHRIIEMGITPGTEIMVVRKAPLGDPIEIKVRGFLLSLRLSDARRIIIRQVAK